MSWPSIDMNIADVQLLVVSIHWYLYTQNHHPKNTFSGSLGGVAGASPGLRQRGVRDDRFDRCPKAQDADEQTGDEEQHIHAEAAHLLPAGEVVSLVQEQPENARQSVFSPMLVTA